MTRINLNLQWETLLEVSRFHGISLEMFSALFNYRTSNRSCYPPLSSCKRFASFQFIGFRDLRPVKFRNVRWRVGWQSGNAVHMHRGCSVPPGRVPWPHVIHRCLQVIRGPYWQAMLAVGGSKKCWWSCIWCCMLCSPQLCSFRRLKVEPYFSVLSLVYVHQGRLGVGEFRSMFCGF
jgi:hypothetical protein